MIVSTVVQYDCAEASAKPSVPSQAKLKAIGNCNGIYIPSIIISGLLGSLVQVLQTIGFL